MATEHRTAGEAQDSVPVSSGAHGQLMVAYGTVEIDAKVDTASTWKMCKVPGNSLIVGGFFAGDKELEAGSTEAFNFDIGFTGDTDAICLGVITPLNDAAAVLQLSYMGLPLMFYQPLVPKAGVAWPVDVGTDPVDIIVTTTGTPQTTGTGTAQLVVYYTQKLYPVPGAQTEP